MSTTIPNPFASPAGAARRVENAFPDAPSRSNRPNAPMFYAIAVCDGYNAPEPAGIVYGTRERIQMVSAIQKAVKAANVNSYRVEKFSASTPEDAMDWLEHICELHGLPRNMTDPSRPICFQPDYVSARFESMRKARSNDESWVEDVSFSYNEPSQTKESTVAIFGARPTDLYSKDNESLRYLRDGWQNMLEDIKAALRDLADQGVYTVVTDETQGAAQLGHWAAEALKREGYEMANDVYVSWQGVEDAWNKQSPVFSAGDFVCELECADNVTYLRDAPENGRLPYSEYRALNESKMQSMSARAGFGICATAYGTATVAAAPGQTLDMPAITAALTAAGRQQVYSLADVPAAHVAANAALAAATTQEKAIAGQLEQAKTKLEGFEFVAAQGGETDRESTEFINECLASARADVENIENRLSAAQGEVKQAKGALKDCDAIAKASQCCNIEAALSSLGNQARGRKTVAAYGEQAKEPRAVETVRLQPHAQAMKQER